MMQEVIVDNEFKDKYAQFYFGTKKVVEEEK